MYYISHTRNDKDQVGAFKQAYYITQTLLMVPSKQSQEYWVNTPTAHLTVKVRVYITGIGGVAHA